MHLLRTLLPATLLLGVLPVTPARAETSRNQVIAAYVQAWSEAAPEKRRQLLEQAVVEQVQYLDPYSSAGSRKALDALIRDAHAQLPGLRGEVVGRLRQTGNAGLFEWKMYGAGGEVLFYGVDAVSFAADGRLQRIEGFFETRLQQ
ncbi:hypothetical protein N8I74_07930 [Chitiniphilus purpureus]|uniref:Nuclear transport factor 2 family protein n=1 Tax=Chitiniphilus purpureus TaxID=2981137 RepID=A0ABY6DRD8_9NEIS|nr:hypothetical protein [Chitiniphilus sp. CD1]UXY16932.1 hypothetical protein N8I74_07930 [Chitiniphilus sp. CD1]